jgi:hypothetical protein
MKTLSTGGTFVLGLVAVLGSVVVPVASSRAVDSTKADSVYIGDGGDNTVKRFDAETGTFLGVFVTPSAGGLDGPRSPIFDRPAGDCNHDGGVTVDELVVAVNIALASAPMSACKAGDRNADGQVTVEELVTAVNCALDGCDDGLLLVNQNAHGTVNGEVLGYEGQTGAFVKPIIPATNPNGPFAPRGMVLWNHEVLFVADQNGNLPAFGRLLAFAKDGEFLADLTPNRKLHFAAVRADDAKQVAHDLAPGPISYNAEFYPSGMVIGPDGKLYVAVRYFNRCGGGVLRWDPVSGNFLDVFVSNSGNCADNVNGLHRPEGLVFGPDGNLYIASRSADIGAPQGDDSDKILIVQGPNGSSPGAYVDQIDLDVAGQPPASAQTLLFGPHGRLFVPINDIDSINDTESVNGPNTGAVRRYNVQTKEFDVFVPPRAQGGPLVSPWYLTFGNTDPATLAYQGD